MMYEHYNGISYLISEVCMYASSRRKSPSVLVLSVARLALIVLMTATIPQFVWAQAVLPEPPIRYAPPLHQVPEDQKLSISASKHLEAVQILLPKPQIEGVPGQTQAILAVPPDGQHRPLWNAAMDIRYGATFDLRMSDTHAFTLEEQYSFVETEGSAPVRALAYCLEKLPFGPQDSPETFCPPQSLVGSDLRLSKSGRLQVNQYSSRGLLYEELVLSAQPVWILVQEKNEQPHWRFLNYFQGLHDVYNDPGNTRMTTLFMAPHTFVLSLPITPSELTCGCGQRRDSSCEDPAIAHLL
jgi:hypothetical protein